MVDPIDGDRLRASAFIATLRATATEARAAQDLVTRAITDGRLAAGSAVSAANLKATGLSAAVAQRLVEAYRVNKALRQWFAGGRKIIPGNERFWSVGPEPKKRKSPPVEIILGGYSPGFGGMDDDQAWGQIWLVSEALVIVEDPTGWSGRCGCSASSHSTVRSGIPGCRVWLIGTRGLRCRGGRRPWLCYR